MINVVYSGQHRQVESGSRTVLKSAAESEWGLGTLSVWFLTKLISFITIFHIVMFPDGIRLEHSKILLLFTVWPISVVNNGCSASKKTLSP